MDHVDVLGRSIADPLVQAYLAEQERADPADFHTNAERGFFGGSGSGFGLRAETLRQYLGGYEAARSRALPDEDEMIVTQLTFTGADALRAEQRVYPWALPFGLTFGAGADDVARALGVAPFRNSPSSNLPGYSAVRFDSWYRVEPTFMIAKYDEALRLMAVSILAVDKATRQADRRLTSTQHVGTAPGRLDAIEALRAEFPTPRWREAMDDGDELFTEDRIAEAERLLDAFIDTVKSAAARARAADIFAAVEPLVLGLNGLNERTGMIETLERDELGMFIDEVVKATGVELAEGEDITSPWREW